MTAAQSHGLDVLLRALHLPTFLAQHGETAKLAEREGWAFPKFLQALCEHELSDREVRRVERLRHKSRLPPEKTAATLDLARLPAKVAVCKKTTSASAGRAGGGRRHSRGREEAPECVRDSRSGRASGR